MRTTAPMRGLNITGGYFEGDEPKPEEINASDPRIQAIVKAAVDEQVAGLKANNSELIEEKRAAKKALDELKAQWGDLDPEAVKTVMLRLENDEDTRLIAEGKVDEVIERRVGTMRKNLENQLAKAQDALTQRDESLAAKDGKIKVLLLERDLQAAAVKLGVVPSALEDAVAAAARTFQMNDDMELEAREGDLLLTGTDGKSSLTPAEWLEAQQEVRPHWWPPSQGAGSGGGDGRPGTGKKGVDLDKVSPRNKLAMGMYDAQ